MKIRRLNKLGIKKFEAYLESLMNDGSSQEDPPFGLLENPETSEPFPCDVEIEKREFMTRYEMGQYLVKILDQCCQRIINSDHGLWSWLAFFLFRPTLSARNRWTKAAVNGL